MSNEKTFVYDIEIKGTDQQVKRLNELEIELKAISAERKRLIKVQSEGETLNRQQAQTLQRITQQERQLRGEKTKLTADIKKQDQAVGRATGSYNALVAANSKLVQVYRKLDPANKDQARQMTLISAKIKDNTDKLTAMDATMGRHQRNVGNYSGAIKGAFGNLGLFSREMMIAEQLFAIITAATKSSTAAATASAAATKASAAATKSSVAATQAATVAKEVSTVATETATTATVAATVVTETDTVATKASAVAKKGAAAATGLFSGALRILKIALISTGIGAIVVAVGSMAAYFKSSSAAALEFRNAIAPLEALFGNLFEIWQTFGKTYFKVLTDWRNAWTHIKDGVKEVRDQVNSLGDDTRREVSLLRSLNTLRDSAAKIEIKNIEKLSELEAKLAESRDNALDKENYSLEQRRKFMQNAIALNAQVREIEKTNALNKISEMRIALKLEQNDAQVKNETLRQLAEANAEYNQAQRDFFNEQRGMRRQMSKLDNEALQASKEAAEEVNRQHEEMLQLIEARNKANTIGVMSIVPAAIQAEQMITRTTEQEAYKRKQIRKTETEQQIDAWSMVASAASNLAKEGTNTYRVLASGEALISTYAAINKTLKEPTLPFPSNIIMSAIIGAMGLGNVAKINGLQFAGGGRVPYGYELPGFPKSGDNTPAMLKPDEVILNTTQQAALGGANTFRKIGVPGFADGGIPQSPSTIAASNLRRSIDTIKVEVVESEVRGKMKYVDVVEKLTRF